MNLAQKILTVLALACLFMVLAEGPAERTQEQGYDGRMKKPDLKIVDYRRMVSGFFFVAVAYTGLMFVFKSGKLK